MSRFSGNPADTVWFVHAPAKNEKRPIKETAPSSQIPYLNGVQDTAEDLTKQSEMWFKETDSPFIRLSKIGGRQDLLVHKTKALSKDPVGYPQPDWWTDMLIDVNNPQPKEEGYGHVFEVPAWFAHQHKVYDQQKVKPVQPQYHLDPNFNPKLQKYDAIEEPLKYGQLRNYKNPANVKITNKDQRRQYETNSSNFIRKIGDT